MTEQTDSSSMVKHPNHYNVYDVEVLDMMAAIWGNEAVALWCKMTAFKYRMRMGYKAGVDPSTDFKKEQECLELMRKYKDRCKNSDSVDYHKNYKLIEDNNTVTICDSFTDSDITNITVAK